MKMAQVIILFQMAWRVIISRLRFLILDPMITLIWMYKLPWDGKKLKSNRPPRLKVE